MRGEKQGDLQKGKSQRKDLNWLEQDERYRALVENIPGAVYRCAMDEHWTMEFLSVAIETISGFKADDFIGNRVRSYASIIHPDDLETVDRKVRAAVEEMEPYILQYRIIDAKGEIKWIYEKGRALYDRDDLPIWLDGVIFDSTDQYKAIQALETEYAQLLAIFDSMDEVIYVADPQNYNLLYGNEVFRRNWGDPIGQKCYRALQGRDSPCPFCTNDKIFGENLGKPYIWEFQNEVNQRWYRCIDRAIKWTDGKMVRFEMAIDNHDLKMAQIELEEYRDHLEKLVEERTMQLDIAKKQAEKANASKSDFLAQMSHEIRTPLNAVTGLTNLVLKSDLTVEQRDYLDKVQIAANNLLDVISDILDFSRVEAGRLELLNAPFDLERVMEQVVDLFSDRVAQKDLELVFSMAAEVPRLLIGDGNRLTQVLTNLIENGVKFSDTGEIVVSVDLAEPVDSQTGHVMLRFQVSDNGIGIAADVLPTLFEAFTQADGYLTREQQGAGLGLAICKRLVELMGGRIWAESTLGQGSIFSFTAEFEVQREEKQRFVLPQALHGLKTLVVDDSNTARQVLVDLLQSFTFNVAAVSNGDEAIAKLREAQREEPFQLVLLDWKMPGMDGFEVVKLISRDLSVHRPQFIIMVTAYGRELVQAKVDKTLVDDWLLKPVKASTLFDSILGLMGQAGELAKQPGGEPVTKSIDKLSGHRLLLVEDSDLNRYVAMALLEEAGLEVEVAENGEVAVSKVNQSPKGYYDAVLMDIQMPVMDGYEATAKIRELEQQQLTSSERSAYRVPVIALTAHALKGEKEKCLAAGMDDYLAKPIDEQELHRVLFKWLAP